MPNPVVHSVMETERLLAGLYIVYKFESPSDRLDRMSRQELYALAHGLLVQREEISRAVERNHTCIYLPGFCAKEASFSTQEFFNELEKHLQIIKNETEERASRAANALLGPTAFG